MVVVYCGQVTIVVVLYCGQVTIQLYSTAVSLQCSGCIVLRPGYNSGCIVVRPGYNSCIVLR